MKPIHILLGADASEKTLAKALEATFVDVRDPARRYTSFIWLLVLSSVIATGGIAAGSSAVIIGAMLIAPLMSPMLGTTLAIVTGRPKDAVRTFAMTAAGVLVSITVAIGVAAIIPVGVDTATNAEVLARTSPRLVDLVIALAAGATASLAAIREDIPDAVPGVAIAASIVPPLCVIGVSIFEGDLDAALGAWLLFVANYFAIQVMGLAVFLIAGLGRGAATKKSKEIRYFWYGAAAVGIVAVSIPLFMSSADIASQASSERTVRSIVQEWVSDADGYRVKSIDVGRDTLSLELAGYGEKPSPEELEEMLSSSGCGKETLRVSYVEEVCI